MLFLLMLYSLGGRGVFWCNMMLVQIVCGESCSNAADVVLYILEVCKMSPALLWWWYNIDIRIDVSSFSETCSAASCPFGMSIQIRWMSARNWSPALVIVVLCCMLLKDVER